MTVRPTRRAAGLAAGALALFAVGTNVQAGWVLAVAALMCGVLGAGGVLPLRAVRGITVVRRAPARVTAGERFVVTLGLERRGRARGSVLAIDAFAAPAAVVAWSTPATLATVRDAARRGVYASAPVTLEAGGPLGVVRVRRTVDVQTPVVVHPRVFPVTLDAVTAAAPRPVSDEPAGVRDYRPGDAVRHVHWRSTARRGALVIREFDDRAAGDVAVAAFVPVDDVAADAVASAAASVALAAVRAGGRVELHDADGATLARSPDAVLDWAARLRPGAPSLPDGDSVVAVVPPSMAAALPDAIERVVVVVTEDAGSAGAIAHLRSRGADVRLAAGDRIHRCA